MGAGINRRSFLRGMGALVGSPLLKGSPTKILAEVLEAPLSDSLPSEGPLWEILDSFQNHVGEIIAPADGRVSTYLEIKMGESIPGLSRLRGVYSEVLEFADLISHLEFMTLFPDDLLEQSYAYTSQFYKQVLQNEAGESFEEIIEGHPFFEAIRSQQGIRQYINHVWKQMLDFVGTIDSEPKSRQLTADMVFYHVDKYTIGNLTIPHDIRANLDWRNPLNLNWAVEHKFFNKFSIRLNRYPLTEDLHALLDRYEQSQLFRWGQSESIADMYQPFMKDDGGRFITAAEKEFFENNRLRLNEIWREFADRYARGPNLFSTNILDRDLLSTRMKELEKWNRSVPGLSDNGLKCLFQSTAVRFICLDEDQAVYQLSWDQSFLTLSQADIIEPSLRRAFKGVMLTELTLFGLIIRPHPILDEYQTANERMVLRSWHGANQKSHTYATRGITPPSLT